MNMIRKAIKFAAEKHKDQYRKGTKIPYIVHPFEVYEIARNYTDDKNILIACLLHDTLEDTDTTFEEIKNLFGYDVAYLVNCLTIKKYDSYYFEKACYVNKLNDCNDTVLFIKSCDLLANLRDMYNDYESIGDILWERFNGNYKELVYYYNHLYYVLLEHLKSNEILKECKKYINHLFPLKWEYAKMPGYITRALNILTGTIEQIMTRGNPYYKLVGYEEENLGLYGTTDRIVSEEEALKYAIEELGATKEDFYKED